MPQNDIPSQIAKILDITSRVDERMEIIQKGQNDINQRLDGLVATISNDTSRISVLESKNGNRTHQVEEDVHDIDLRLTKIEVNQIPNESIHQLEIKVAAILQSSSGWTTQVRFYINLVVQGLWVVIVSYLLYRLGISSPPGP